MHSRKTSSSIKSINKVQVLLRIRPKQLHEQEQNYIEKEDTNTIIVKKLGLNSYMRFNYVQYSQFQTQSQSQQDIFAIVQQSVVSLFDGIDATIFAYGQTGAGKTYTIIGNCPQNDADITQFKSALKNHEKGILPRALELIFKEQKKKRNCRITIKFFQIYNEKVYNLLSNDFRPLDIKEGQKGETILPQLQPLQIINFDQMLQYVAKGIKNRVTSSTSANVKSSRSHSIFELKYEQLIVNKNANSVLVSHFRVVDLAGSQKFNIPPNLSQSQKQLRLLQLKSINGSLSKLGHCISALSIGSRTHIPVRESKLTRILSDALIGSSKIRLIVCASPSMSSLNETSSTLQFADRVKKAVFQKPFISPVKHNVPYEKYVQVLHQLESQKNRRMQLQKIINTNTEEQKDFFLLNQNEKLRQQIMLLKKSFKNTQQVSKSPNNCRNLFQRITTKSNYEQILTPPKSSITKSYRGSEIAKSQNNSIQKRGKDKKKFEHKICKFLQSSNIDDVMQTKIKERLQQIKQQLVGRQNDLNKELWSS